MLKYSELILEKRLNESVVYFSPPFRKVLKKLDNKIANDLLEIEGDNIKPDVTFIDTQEKEGYISFTTMKNAWKKIKDLDIEYIKSDDDPKHSKYLRKKVADYIYIGSESEVKDVYLKSRNLLKIGKFANKVFPKKYTQQEIEEFTNLFKAKTSTKGEEFKIVEGEDIAFWYKEENHKYDRGDLGNSCMRDCGSGVFDLYVKSKDVCKMLILLENDLLLGRALIWKLSDIKIPNYKGELPTHFMDRQYTSKDSDVIKFIEYAEKKGWAFKAENNHHNLSEITFKGENYFADMEVQLETSNFKGYPYLDTFRRLDTYDNTLYNDDGDDTESYILDDIGGGYTDNSGVWSDYDEDYIYEDDAVWSDYANSYLHVSRALYVADGDYSNQGWYPEYCDDVVEDEFTMRPYHIDDVMLSKVYDNTYIAKEEAVLAVIGEKNGKPVISEDYYHLDDSRISYLEYRHNGVDGTWFKILSGLDSRWKTLPVHEDILQKNYMNKKILKEYSMEAYGVKDKKSKIRFLTLIDSEILELEIDFNVNLIIDKFEYYNKRFIKQFIPKLVEGYKLKIKKIEKKPDKFSKKKIKSIKRDIYNLERKFYQE